MARYSGLLILLVFFILTAKWAHSSDLDAKSGDNDVKYPTFLYPELRNTYKIRRARLACVDQGGNCDHNPNVCCQSLGCVIFGVLTVDVSAQAYLK